MTKKIEDLKIMAVDDASVIRTIVSTMLKKMGVKKVITTYSGMKAYNILLEAVEKNEPFDLIISDWNMSPMSGLALLKKVKNNPIIHKTKFMMLTAESERDKIEEAVSKGVDCYLSKPFTYQGLSEKVNKMVNLNL